MINTINYKYSKGQKLFYIKTKSVPTLITCPTCEGQGSLVIPVSLKQFVCPTCMGEKTVSNSGSIKYVVFYGEVRKIEIDVDYATTINYRMLNEELEAGNYHFVLEEELYEDKEKAEKECEIMNSKCLMGYTS